MRRILRCAGISSLWNWPQLAQLNISSELLALGELIEHFNFQFISFNSYKTCQYRKCFPKWLNIQILRLTRFLRTEGWGAFDSSLKQSQRLKQVELSLNKVTECDCEDQYFLYTDVGPSRDDTCAGDSGQPMRGEHPVTWSQAQPNRDEYVRVSE